MLREFLYVDMTRTRSLLAQLDEGVVETTVNKRSSDRGIDLQAAFGALSGGARRSDSSESAQTRSLEDFLFVALEEIIEAEGILTDVDCGSVQDWEESAIHGELQEGQLIRVNADVMLLDGKFLKNRLNRVMSIADSHAAALEVEWEQNIQPKREEIEAELAAAAEGSASEKRSHNKNLLAKKVESRLEELKLEAFEQSSGSRMEALKPATEMMVSFLSSEAITVRVVPHGIEHPQFSFVGSLLKRDEYIQQEREALFSRYGSLVMGWTCVLQIAAIPQRKTSAKKFDSRSIGEALNSTKGVERSAMEALGLALLAELDESGISEGPRWPAISVVPLGIYRTVPGSLNQERDADESC